MENLRTWMHAVAAALMLLGSVAAYGQPQFPAKPIRIVTSEAGGGLGSRRWGCFWGGDRARPPFSWHGASRWIGLVLFGVASFVTTSVFAQTYPAKPVRIVTSEAGGAGDLSARLIAQVVSANVGQPVIVDNRGGGVIAGDFVAKAPPDGYTVLSYGNTFWLLPLMREQMPYDPGRDFLPVTTTVSAISVLVVHPSVPAKSAKELIALARGRPGDLNYGSGATGTSNHLAAELFKSMAKVNITRVPYKGVASALTSLISGEIQIMFPQLASALPHMKSGRVRALAVTSAKPSVLAPGLPTVAASGVPGYATSGTFGMFVPARTPAAIVSRLNREIVAALKKTDMVEKLQGAGLEVVGSTPEELTAVMRSEIALMVKVIRDANIRDQ